MLKHLKKIIFISLLSLSTAHATVEITPNNNGSGVLPNGHDEIIFKLSDGNWTKNVRFPKQPKNNDIVTIQSSASYDTYIIDGYKTNLPYVDLLLKAGQYYKFIYNSDKKEWVTQVSTQYPINNSEYTAVKISNNNVTAFNMADGRWTPHIVLPNNILANKFVFITSQASSPSKIHASDRTYILTKGQYYIFVFDEDNKWRLAKRL